MQPATLFVSFSLEEFQSFLEDIVTKTVQRMLSQFQPEDPDELITIDEVCAILKRSKPAIHKWKKNGTLPFYRLEGNVYFKRHEVLAAPQKANVRVS